ncbi:MAG: lysine--tRNA ligase [Alphaproteobacteria bacterium]|nr:lysine--tRNA ligase [Alphaproteobacteria bacterium]
MTSELRDAMQASNAWPFVEARKLVERVERHPSPAGVLFETGYGPSGLPHIGTFGEVARTAMVRHAFECLAPGVKTHLIAFSDDMDGLRKVPSNLPNQEMLTAHLGLPLSRVPDPFGTHESFAAHNNARLCAFLDQFGFAYEFRSSTAAYTSGAFDAALLRMLAVYDEVMDIILPTLGPERRASYSPFLPVSPKTGRVLQVPVEARDTAAGTIVFRDEDGTRTELPVTGGHVKCQWKADWALRWHALGVDYEMAGKDLIDSVTLSSRICRALGSLPPEGFNYELFLDEKGEKISKSRGNGLTIEEWLRYASPESLSLFMYAAPRKAKRLHFDVIPKTVDEYIQFLKAVHTEDPVEQLRNPVWHIHSGRPPQEDCPLSFALLLNLVSASNSEEADVLWGFIRRYDASLDPQSHPLLGRLVDYAITYYHDFVRPTKAFRAASATEALALAELRAELARLAEIRPQADGEAIQEIVYEVGKAHGFEPLRAWFQALYEVLLGQSQGPRFGSFVALYGIGATLDLIDRALAGELAGSSASVTPAGASRRD